MRNRRRNIVHQQQSFRKEKVFQCFNMMLWEMEKYKNNLGDS